ncbi:MAG TPA: methyltransferase domain-containing protein, partial [Pilimelia sp.]|nr:methyltransferase domain-containing protein [Pilimelia sp.]
SGMLDVAEETGDPETRRFRLPPGGAEVLCDGESLFHVTPLASMAVGVVGTLDAVAEAFRTGGKVPFESYGSAMRDGIARMNRPMFDHLLASEWVPALPDIDARLRAASPPAHVADLGCGGGASSVALARGYPHARVDGIDLDEESVAAARRAAAAAGVSDRVTFAVRDAADPALRGRYDLVTLFETLHDMAHPVAALRAARGLLADGGAVLVGDQRVADRFTAPGDDLERFNYGWSATHCLAAAWGEPDSAGTGTVLRADTVRRYAGEAGFSRTTVLPIENDFWRFYRLDP